MHILKVLINRHSNYKFYASHVAQWLDKNAINIFPASNIINTNGYDVFLLIYIFTSY